MRPLSLTIAMAAILPFSALADVPDQVGWDDARQTVSVGGELVAGYVELGADPAQAKGAPIVLIHGYTDNS